MNKHKAKCDKLKKIRKSIADKIGVNLHQVECTYDKDCKGTCPKCKQEEDLLNRALAQKAGALAVGAITVISLSGCKPTSEIIDYQGLMTYPDNHIEIEGIPENENENENENEIKQDSGLNDLPDDLQLSGDIEIIQDENSENDFDTPDDLDDLDDLDTGDELPPILSEGVLPYEG